jgi:hypothetical protein
MFLRHAVRICILSLVVALAACAGAPTVSMTAESRGAIKSVTLNPQVQIPPEMFYHGRAQSISAGVGGLVGAAIVQSMPQEPKEALLDTMKTKGISVDQILKAEFVRAVSAKSRLRISEGAGPQDAELSLAINAYGFGQTQGFSALLYPMLAVTATLRKRDGSIVWQKKDFVGPLNSLNNQGYEYEQYMIDPELIRKVLTNVSSILSDLLVADLQGAN